MNLEKDRRPSGLKQRQHYYTVQRATHDLSTSIAYVDSQSADKDKEALAKLIVDLILSYHVVLELRNAFRHCMFVAYVDLKKAEDGI